MYAVKVEDGIVVNRAVGNPGEGWIENDEAQIGWAYDGKAFSAPPTPPSPPPPPLVAASADVTVDRIAVLERALLDKGVLAKADVTKAEAIVRARMSP